MATFILYIILVTWMSVTASNTTGNITSTFIEHLLTLDTSLTPSLQGNLPVLYCNTYCNGTMGPLIISTNIPPSSPMCPPCRCSEDCHKYGDCCPDAEGNVYWNNAHKCLTFEIGSYLVFPRCPNENNTKEYLSFDNVAPVTSVDSKITYINENIAHCHGENNITTWPSLPKCEKKSMNSSSEILISCRPNFFRPDKTYTRFCFPMFYDDVISTCNKTGLWNGTTFGLDVDLDVQCEERGQYPVVKGDIAFKNIYCFLCNGLDIEELVPNGYGGGSGGSGHQVTGLTDLVSFTHDRKSCGDGFWDDWIKDTCRTILCRQGYILHEGQCEMSKVSLSSVLYHLTATFWTPTDQLDPALRHFQTVKDMLLDNIPDIMTSYNFTECVYTVYRLSNDKNLYHGKTRLFGLTLMMKNSQNCCRADFEDQISKPSFFRWTVFLNNTNHTFELTSENFQTFKFLGVIESQTFISANETVVPTLSDIETYLSSFTDDVQEYIELPFIRPICSSVSLIATEYKKNDDVSINLTYADVVLSPGEVTMNKKKLFVCIETLEEVYEKLGRPIDYVKRAENILTLFFSILSLICLTLTFITYCTFQSLLTLPTKNTMCLVVHLFIAQFLLLFKGLAATEETTCKVIGVLVHYFWLCVVFWMNVCSFHMFRVFVIDADKPICVQRDFPRLIRYFCYANGSSLMIVIVTIVFNVAFTGYIGYGHGTCYLSSALLTGIAFVLPLVIVLIVNIFFFCICVWTMTRIHKKSGSTRHDRGNVHVYIKLSTLTGVFWTLSILAENLHLQVLVFLAIILNASQGVFIFISYVANRRVLNLWKARFSRNVAPETDSNGTHSSHT